MDRKILNWDTLDSTLESINKEKIVFTNGCFDILHPGHIHILDLIENSASFDRTSVVSSGATRMHSNAIATSKGR